MQIVVLCDFDLVVSRNKFSTLLLSKGVQSLKDNCFLTRIQRFLPGYRNGDPTGTRFAVAAIFR